MEMEEALEKLKFYKDQVFPLEALRTVIEHRDEVVPVLLAALEDTIDRAEQINEADPDYMLHLYGMFLLAQFRETRAYPLVMKMASLPEPTLDELLGDTITEGLKRIIASVWDGDVAPIKQLIENRDADPYARHAGLESLIILLFQKKLAREEVVEYLREVILDANERRDWEMFTHSAEAAVAIWPGELMEEIRRGYEQGLLDEFMMSFAEVEEVLEMGLEECWQELADDAQYNHLIDDVEEEMAWWPMFHPKRYPANLPGDKEDEFHFERPSWFGSVNDKGTPAQSLSDYPQPYKRTEPKIGRNDPCPCGSGKKYKKCCGR